MRNEFIPYEETLALKEIGCEILNGIKHGGNVFYYDNDKNLYYDHKPMYSSDAHQGQILALLWQQAFRWFREKHLLKGDPQHTSSNGTYQWIIWKWNYDNNIGNWERISEPQSYETHEEAQLACLRKLIEICQNKN